MTEKNFSGNNSRRKRKKSRDFFQLRKNPNLASNTKFLETEISHRSLITGQTDELIIAKEFYRVATPRFFFGKKFYHRVRFDSVLLKNPNQTLTLTLIGRVGLTQFATARD